MNKLNNLLLSLLLIQFPLLLSAQTDSLSDVYLENVVIEENRLKIPFTAASRSIEVLEKTDLQQLPVQSVADALGYVAGVDVRRRGAMGVQADLSIRGGTFEQSLVLINGIKVSDPQTGHHLMNLPLNLDNVERIVVLKGPGARAFGQNAFAGAVNIITKIPEQRKVAFSGYGGAFGSYGGTVSLALPSEGYKQYISLSGDWSDGYRHNTDYSLLNAFYQSELELGGGKLQIQGGYTDREFGANGFYASPDATEQWETIQTGLLSLSYDKQLGNVTLKPRLYWRTNDDEYLFVRGQPEIYQNIHATNVLGAELNASIETDLGTTGLGFEYRKEDINSTNLGDWQRDNVGMFAEQHLKVGDRFNLTPGVYVNWFSDYGWNAFPGLDAGYLLGQNFRIYASVGRSFRIPTYTDLYYTDPANEGNPNLQPESAWNYEGGVKISNKFLFAQLGYFRRDSNNLIDWIKDSDDDPTWQPRNFSSIVVSGWEMSLEADPSRLESGSPFTHLSLAYTYIDAQLDEAQTVNSRYVLENIRHQLVGRGAYRFLKNFSHSIAVRFVDRVSLDNYWLTDTRLTWEKGDFDLFAEVNNLFDQEYTEVNLVPMPGRWIRLGARVEVSW